VVTMVDDDDSVFAALTAGARGYILKDASAEEITAALRTVAAGGAVFGGAIATRLLARTPRPQATPALAPGETLTVREREVLNQLADGATNRQIARSLNLSLKTVQNHVSRILDKLQADDRTQAVLRARGVAPPPR
jgi:DNA-binding NarL/FixJ family response regulator